MTSTLGGVLSYSSNDVETVRQPVSQIPRKRSACLVIPVWNKSEEAIMLTFRALQSLKEHVDSARVDLDVVVVDNCSPKHSMNRTQAFGLNIDVVNLKRNRGFGPAVNLGFRLYPESDYVIQMNSDCELVDDVVNILIDVIEENHLAASMPEHYENCQHYGLGKSQDLMGNDWRFGAFWVMRRRWWDLVGGFDEDFEMCYFEDTDLFRRVEEEGGRIRGWRGTWIKHKGGSSSLPERDFFFEKNRKLFETRWGK